MLRSFTSFSPFYSLLERGAPLSPSRAIANEDVRGGSPTTVLQLDPRWNAPVFRLELITVESRLFEPVARVHISSSSLPPPFSFSFLYTRVSFHPWPLFDISFSSFHLSFEPLKSRLRRRYRVNCTHTVGDRSSRLILLLFSAGLYVVEVGRSQRVKSGRVLFN